MVQKEQLAVIYGGPNPSPSQPLYQFIHTEGVHTMKVVRTIAAIFLAFAFTTAHAQKTADSTVQKKDRPCRIHEGDQ